MKKENNVIVFLNKFVCKILEKKEGRKKEVIKFYQCPKCLDKNMTGGMLQHPINFIGHLLGNCSDWLNFVPEDEKDLFMGTQISLNKLLKELMLKLQAEMPTK